MSAEQPLAERVTLGRHPEGNVIACGSVVARSTTGRSARTSAANDLFHAGAEDRTVEDGGA